MTGFEPAPPALEAEAFALLPKQVRYQDELHPEGFILSHCLYFVGAAPFHKCLHLWLLSTLDAGVIFISETNFN